MADQRVLAVDDEPVNLDIIVEFLSDLPIELVCEASAEEAWLRMQQDPQPFDLVLLDRMMPGMNGMELLHRMRADSRFADTPVVMQTAAAAPDQVREGLEAGVHYYLTKPYEPETLLAIVRSILGGIAERRELEARAKSGTAVAKLMTQGRFEVRTLGQAHDVAVVIAGRCDNAGQVATGLAELICNGIEHGNLGIGYAEKSRLRRDDHWEAEIERRLALPENAAKRVLVEMSCDKGRVVFRVTDQGPGFDWTRYLDLDPARAFDPNGRGIALARKLCFSRLEFHAPGNCVEAIVDVNGA